MNQTLHPEVIPIAAQPKEPPTTWWHRLTRGSRRWYARPDWVNFVGPAWLDQIMQSDVTDDFHAKQGRSTGRCVLETDDAQLVVYLKRHFELPWLHGLLAALWPTGNWSPAMQERQNLIWAKEQGLPVPDVVAAGEFLDPWGKLQSFLAVEELTNMLPLHQAIPLAARQLEPRIFRFWKAGLTREIARLVKMLHGHGRFHKDLYLCHFFVARADTNGVSSWRGRVHMIDFHRLAHHPFAKSVFQTKDLGQLLFSSEVEGIDTRDRLRFWRAYLGIKRRTVWGRFLSRIVLCGGDVIASIMPRRRSKVRSAALVAASNDRTKIEQPNWLRGNWCQGES